MLLSLYVYSQLYYYMIFLDTSLDRNTFFIKMCVKKYSQTFILKNIAHPVILRSRIL